MSRREEYEMKTEALITPIVDEKGFELVDVEYVKEGSNWYLRAYVDKEGGITINDLESVSRILSDKLNELQFHFPCFCQSPYPSLTDGQAPVNLLPKCKHH